MIPTRRSPDLLAGHWVLISGWGRVPKALVWDNESAVGQWRARRAEVAVARHAVRRHLGVPVTGVRFTPRLPRDHYVRVDSNDYSVHPAAVGRRIEIVADLEHVVVT